MPRGGYRGVVDALADGLPIHLESTVQRIAQHSDGVTVHTSSGAFEGSHVLVTVPLGVLKADAIKFDPPLPPATWPRSSAWGSACWRRW